MKKGKLILLSMGFIGLFLLVPFAQAASSQVWFDESTELIWSFTEEVLDTAGAVTSTNSSFRKLNFTDIVAETDFLNVTGKLYSATTANVTAYGYSNLSIWEYESFTLEREMYDSDIETHFASFFNEQNLDLTSISSLPADNQTMVEMVMVLLLDPTALVTLFIYILVKGLGGSFALDTNSSTINSVSSRKINFDLDIQYGDEDEHGVWENLTFHSNNELTYGKSSNVLLKSICTSTLTGSEGNASGVTSETIRARFTHEIVSPTELTSDYPGIIPGYPIWILAGAIVLGSIPAFLAIKRKKK